MKNLLLHTGLYNNILNLKKRFLFNETPKGPEAEVETSEKNQEAMDNLKNADVKKMLDKYANDTIENGNKALKNADIPRFVMEDLNISGSVDASEAKGSETTESIKEDKTLTSLNNDIDEVQRAIDNKADIKEEYVFMSKDELRDKLNELKFSKIIYKEHGIKPNKEGGNKLTKNENIATKKEGLTENNAEKKGEDADKLEEARGIGKAKEGEYRKLLKGLPGMARSVSREFNRYIKAGKTNEAKLFFYFVIIL